MQFDICSAGLRRGCAESKEGFACTPSRLQPLRTLPAFIKILAEKQTVLLVTNLSSCFTLKYGIKLGSCYPGCCASEHWVGSSGHHTHHHPRVAITDTPASCTRADMVTVTLLLRVRGLSPCSQSHWCRHGQPHRAFPSSLLGSIPARH